MRPYCRQRDDDVWEDSWADLYAKHGGRHDPLRRAVRALAVVFMVYGAVGVVLYAATWLVKR